MIIDQSDFVARVRYQNKNVEFDDEQSDFWGRVSVSEASGR